MLHQRVGQFSQHIPELLFDISLSPRSSRTVLSSDALLCDVF